MFKTKGGGVKGFLNNVQKNCGSGGTWHPLVIASKPQFRKFCNNCSLWCGNSKFFWLFDEEILYFDLNFEFKLEDGWLSYVEILNFKLEDGWLFDVEILNFDLNF